jgi:hypothetical protein
MGIVLGGGLPDAPPQPVIPFWLPPHPEAPPQPLGPPQPLLPKDAPGMATPTPAMSPAMLRLARVCLRLFFVITCLPSRLRKLIEFYTAILLIKLIRKSVLVASELSYLAVSVAGGPGFP